MVNWGAEQRSSVSYQLEFVKSFVSFSVSLPCRSRAEDPTKEWKNLAVQADPLAPILCSRPKNCAIPNQKPPLYWSKPNPDPHPGKRHVSPHLLSELSIGVVQWNSVLPNLLWLTSTVMTGHLRILRLHKCKSQPYLRFPSFQQDGGQARDPRRPLKIN